MDNPFAYLENARQARIAGAARASQAQRESEQAARRALAERSRAIQHAATRLECVVVPILELLRDVAYPGGTVRCHPDAAAWHIVAYNDDTEFGSSEAVVSVVGEFDGRDRAIRFRSYRMLSGLSWPSGAAIHSPVLGKRSPT